MYRPQLDGLRCLAFLGVFAAHCRPDVMWWGGFGVQVFFVLSGFLITRILLDHDGGPFWPTLRIFYIRRGLRVFPAYYLLLAAMLFIGATRFLPWHATYTFNMLCWSLTDAGRHGELLANWHGEGLHLWSMSIEEQFYLLFPFALYWAPRKGRVPLTLLGIAGAIVCRILLDRHNPQAYYGALLPVCGEYILWGSLAAQIDFRGGLSRWSPRVARWVGIGLFAVLVWVGKPSRPTGAIFAQFIPVPNDTPWALGMQTGYAVAFTALIWGLWSGRTSGLSWLLSRPPLTYLGKISYGLYLVHLPLWGAVPFFARALERIGLPGSDAMIFAALFLSTLALATASWRLVEAPINDLKRRFPYPPSS